MKFSDWTFIDMEKIQLKILGISSGNVASSYTLILEEINGERKLPIVIGVLEAQAIAIEIEKIEPIRPMTHDLFKSFSMSFNIRVKEVIIHKLHEGIFYSYLIATDGKETKKIDSRTSDAIALALRFNCPIYTHEDILQDAGIALKSFQMKDMEENSEKEGTEGEDEVAAEESFDDTMDKAKSENKESLTKHSINELKKMLDAAINEEDYILAAKLRDAIKQKEDKL